MSSDPVLQILNDPRPIHAIHSLGSSRMSYRVGMNCEEIRPYGEPGPYTLLPWLAVYQGGEITYRFPASIVCISYFSTMVNSERDLQVVRRRFNTEDIKHARDEIGGVKYSAFPFTKETVEQTNEFTRLYTIRDKAKALAKVLHAISADKSYQGIWALANSHGLQYTGPTYHAQLEELEYALDFEEKHGKPR